MEQGTSRTSKQKNKENIALSVVFVALVLVVNMIFYALGSHFSLFANMTEPEYDTLSGVSDAYFDKINPQKDDVTLYFCMSKEELTGNFTYGRIYDMARQFEERYAFFHIAYLDIYRDYETVEALSAMQRENEEENFSVGTATVIFACEATGIAAFRNLNSFYVYDEENTEDDDMIFLGEELISGCCNLVLTAERPKAYFTVGHGETLTASMKNALFMAGFDIVVADLSSYAIEEDCALIVISAPIYDFEEFADPSIVSEISRLRDFVDGGGALWVLRDPLATSLSRLDSFCAEYGLSVTKDAYLKDNAESLNTSATTLLLQPTDSAYTLSLTARIAEAAGMPLSVSAASGRSSAIALTASEKADTYALLQSFPSAYLVNKSGAALTEAGIHITAAVAKIKETGGSLTLFGSGSFADEILMETDAYANRDLLFALAEENTGVLTPIGCGTIIINASPLEHLTRGTAVAYFVALTVGIPVLILALGTVIYFRRRSR